jgi:hypothetical protein
VEKGLGLKYLARERELELVVVGVLILGNALVQAVGFLFAASLVWGACPPKTGPFDMLGSPGQREVGYEEEAVQ